MPQTEQEKFLENVEENDLMNRPLDINSEEEEKPKEDEEEEQEEETQQLRNRRERRLAAKLEAERQSSMQLAAKLEAMSEIQKVQKEGTKEDKLAMIERIYGTDTPEGLASTQILKEALNTIREEVRNETLAELRREQQQYAETQQADERVLDQMMEEIEDEYNVDFSSSKNKNLRNGFLSMLEKLSPKDKEGNIIEYADPYAVWETYSSGLEKRQNNKAKELASRSMTTSGSAKEGQEEQDATWQALKEAGIF